MDALIKFSEHYESIVISFSQKLTWIGAVGTTVSGGIQKAVERFPEIAPGLDPGVAEFGVYFGAGIGVCGLVIQVIANWRRDKREAREERRRLEMHRLKMKSMQAGDDPLLPTEDFDK